MKKKMRNNSKHVVEKIVHGKKSACSAEMIESAFIYIGPHAYNANE